MRSPSRGFSLTELAPVLGILLLLMAIAIPTFLGQRRKVNDTQSQEALRAVQLEARTFTVSGIPGHFDVDLVGRFPLPVFCSGPDDKCWPPMPPYTLTAGPSTHPEIISVAYDADPGAEAADRMVYSSQSASGTCWVLVDDLNDAIRYGILEEEVCSASAVDPSLITASSFDELD